METRKDRLTRRNPDGGINVDDLPAALEKLAAHEDAEDALDEIEKNRGDCPVKRPECARPRNPGSCYQCPYSYIPEGFDGGCMIAQEKWKLRPKKPILRNSDEFCCELNVCPTCGHIVEGVESMENFKFCPGCGQRIDWEGALKDALGG